MLTPADVPPDTWTPVPTRWRHVQAGDVMLDRAGKPWCVTAAADVGLARRVTAVRGDQTFTADRDLDEHARVLVPLVEVAATTLLVEAGLSPTLISAATA